MSRSHSVPSHARVASPHRMIWTMMHHHAIKGKFSHSIPSTGKTCATLRVAFVGIVAIPKSPEWPAALLLPSGLELSWKTRRPLLHPCGGATQEPWQKQVAPLCGSFVNINQKAKKAQAKIDSTIRWSKDSDDRRKDSVGLWIPLRWYPMRSAKARLCFRTVPSQRANWLSLRSGCQCARPQFPADLSRYEVLLCTR